MATTLRIIGYGERRKPCAKSNGENTSYPDMDTGFRIGQLPTLAKKKNSLVLSIYLNFTISWMSREKCLHFWFLSGKLHVL